MSITYKYYFLLRPPSLGTHPNGEVKIVDFNDKRKVIIYDEKTKTSIRREVWGYVLYDKPIQNPENWDLLYESRFGKPKFMSEEEWDNLDDLDLLYYHSLEEDRIISSYIKKFLDEGDTFKIPKITSDFKLDEWLIVSPYTKGKDYKYQMTIFDRKMNPVGDVPFNDWDNLSSMLSEYGYSRTILIYDEKGRKPMRVKKAKDIQKDYHELINKKRERVKEVS